MNSNNTLLARTPLASIIVPTRNRKNELRQCITAALAQTIPVEVIVMDDASTDGTPEMMATEFPNVRYINDRLHVGLCCLDNKAAKLASAPFLVFLDDDAVLVSPKTVEQVLSEFNDSHIGAVTIPFININFNNHVYQQAPAGKEIFVCSSYIGTSCAVKKDLFLEIGGYPEEFFVNVEEYDFCLRLLNNGFVTCLGRSDPVHHLLSPSRDSKSQEYLKRRNGIYLTFSRMPILILPFHLLATIIINIRASMYEGFFKYGLKGIIGGCITWFRSGPPRNPVSWSCYKLFRKIRKSKKPIQLFEIKNFLPEKI